MKLHPAMWASTSLRIDSSNRLCDQGRREATRQDKKPTYHSASAAVTDHDCLSVLLEKVVSFVPLGR